MGLIPQMQTAQSRPGFDGEGAGPALASIHSNKKQGSSPGGEREQVPFQFGSSHFLEVDESRLHVRMNKLHTNSVAYIEAMKTIHELSFNRRMGKAHPCAFRGGAGNDSIELFSDS